MSKVESLSQLLPNGVAWDKKTNVNSNLHKLLLSLSHEFAHIDETVNEIEKYYIPMKENLEKEHYLNDWLIFYNIPDACFKDLSNESLSILYLLAKLSDKIVLYGKQSYIELAAFFGVTLTIEYPGTNKIKFVISVSDLDSFPYEFPILFGSKVGILLECIFTKRVPAHIELTFQIVST